MLSIQRRHNVTISGSGTTPMLFAHGFGCDQNMWRYIVPAFERDYRVILFDFVGHGNSDRSAYDPQRYKTLDGYADDVLAICQELDITHGVFVGHSVSAMHHASARRTGEVGDVNDRNALDATSNHGQRRSRTGSVACSILWHFIRNSAAY